MVLFGGDLVKGISLRNTPSANSFRYWCANESGFMVRVDDSDDLVVDVDSGLTRSSGGTRNMDVEADGMKDECVEGV